jgi:hypothetical protein
MWTRLQAAFPAVVSANLMPGHEHLLPAVVDACAAHQRLARICGQLQRKLGIANLFEPLPRPEIVGIDKAARVARYIDLNPCRAGLVDHPLSWPWTTLRDLVGAVPIVMITHEAEESAVRVALSEIDKLDAVKDNTVLIRIEDWR